MTTNYFQLVWDFGNFLYTSIESEQLFSTDQYTKFFVSKQNIKNSTELTQQLERIQRLFIQNGVFVHPQKKNKSKKSFTSGNYFLSSFWSNVFLNQKDKTQTNKSMGFASTNENSRSNRTIGVLGFKLMKLLKEKPYTREALSNLTEFSKQRVCTVLAIYKLLNLVTVDSQTNLYSWNEEQACVIPEIKKYFDTLVAARNSRRLLAQKVLMLTERLSKKIAQKRSNDPRYENISQRIRTTVLRNVSCCATKVTTDSSSIETEKTKELLKNLEENKKELTEFRKKRVILDSEAQKQYLYYSSSLLSNTKIILRGKKAIILKKRSKKSHKKSQQRQRQRQRQKQRQQQKQKQVKVQEQEPVIEAINTSKKLSVDSKNKFLSNRKRSFDQKIQTSQNSTQSTKPNKLIFPTLKKKQSVLIENNFSKQNTLDQGNFFNLPTKNEQKQEKENIIEQVIDEEVVEVQDINSDSVQQQDQDNNDLNEFPNCSNLSSTVTFNEYDFNSSSTFLLGSDNIETYSSPYFDGADELTSYPQTLLSTEYENNELELPGLFPLWNSETLSIPDRFYYYGEW
ncbi:hypothetical protein M0812_11548 [Anaeramoeba flamelloides]|uniref:Uncharacterized protein n=1 Tax=Anaeramoeba flamelloides TaxID=1746091 RepID=A0AAV7ZXZ3_9EUKA|nr:hypothetical protein M0812_11548 [Anaeramoeba flamelloides]